MRLSLESVISQLEVEQTEGIFHVPDYVENYPRFHSWKMRLREHSYPIVVEDETYFREGVRTKLHIAGDYFPNRLFFRSGLIRPRGESHCLFPDKNARIAVDNLSLAQTISWIYKKPIEQILVPSSFFKTAEFLELPVRKRIRIAYDAHLGSHWFEFFSKMQRRMKGAQRFPVFFSDQPVTRSMLMDVFVTTNYTLQKLCDAGIIVPEKGNFIPKSMRNTVDKDGLDYFIRLLYGKCRKIRRAAPSVDAIAESLLKNRVIPYLSERKIIPEKGYSLAEASKRIGVSYYTLYDAARVDRFAVQDNMVQGLEIAFYALDHANLYSFTRKDVEDLFGVNQFPFAAYRWKASSKGTYSRHHYVLPFYHKVVEEARKLFHSDRNRWDAQLALHEIRSLRSALQTG